MSIPANITAELAYLQGQVAAASPLANAPFATIKAMQLNAGNLVNDVQAALTAPSVLDTFAAPLDAPSIVAGFQDVVTAAEDQSKLSLMRGVVGRVASNLDQLV
ncbi:hypothetical protein [Bradyrhizobium sp. Tv2a-2]|uniref:hypothetical protein n=1 Tax=Bradyrhizobium sp. Tv2a-2 TaxID=113395 RepID=UPI00041C7A05|nr:hypothetical protein [Bradyrhizobium sp. Tv2a-2]